ncbi:hypothetical protein WJX82_009781 [Trebouxia sp. C0006]
MLTDKRPGEDLEAETSKHAKYSHELPGTGASSVSGNSVATQSAGSQRNGPPAEEVAVDSVPQAQPQPEPQPKIEDAHEYIQEPQAASHPQQHMSHELPPLLFQPELPSNIAPEALGPGINVAQLGFPSQQLPSAAEMHSQAAVPDSAVPLQQAAALNMEGPVHPQAEGLMYDITQPGAGLIMPSIVAAALSQQPGPSSDFPIVSQSGTPMQDALSDPGDRPFREAIQVRPGGMPVLSSTAQQLAKAHASCAWSGVTLGAHPDWSC